ncbi:MAG TPA: cupin domain-containing protein, partial [Thermoleophilaceae bacterium]
MADYAIKRIDEMEAAFRGAFKRARAELGVEAFGMQVMDLPPNLEQFPEHDHAESGQEEVYLVLRGAAEIEVDGERNPIDPETIVRVGPGAKRKLYTGDEPMRVLALGGVPGQ